MSLFVTLLPCFQGQFTLYFRQHSEWFGRREAKEPGNLSRRRQGACARWHDARPERAERRSPCPARGRSFSPAATRGAFPPRRTIIMSQATTRPVGHLVSKPDGNRPNHHLTNNNGTWWCQITIHQGPFSRRLRFSLKTGNLERARVLRDQVFENLVPNTQAA